LAVISSYWQLLAVIGSYWQLLPVIGSYWQLLAVISNYSVNEHYHWCILHTEKYNWKQHWWPRGS